MASGLFPNNSAGADVTSNRHPDPVRPPSPQMYIDQIVLLNGGVPRRWGVDLTSGRRPNGAWRPKVKELARCRVNLLPKPLRFSRDHERHNRVRFNMAYDGLHAQRNCGTLPGARLQPIVVVAP